MDPSIIDFFEKEIFSIKIFHICLFFAAWLILGLISTIWHYSTRPKFSINNQHFLITGGSSGLGLALAKIIHSQGGIITLIARNMEKLENAKQSIDPDSSRISIYSCDVTNDRAVSRVVSRIERESGPIDSLVCCAGASLPGLVADSPLRDFEQQLELNYLANVRLVKSVLPSMQSRNC